MIFFFLPRFIFIYDFVCVCLYHMCADAYGGQERFSPSTMWIPGIEFKLPVFGNKGLYLLSFLANLVLTKDCIII